MIVVTFTVVISMVMIVSHVHTQERLMRAYMHNMNNNAAGQGDERRLSACRSDVQYTKDIVFQALMYTLVFFAVWTHPLFDAIANRDRDAPYESNRATETARLVLRPLHGFFNLIIFVHHKVRNFRRRHTHLSLYDALKIVFENNADDPAYIVSNLILLERDVALGCVRFAFDERSSSSEDDEDYHPGSAEMSGSLDRVKPFNCLPDQSMEENSRDLDGFSQDLPFEQVRVSDNTTITPVRRSQESWEDNENGDYIDSNSEIITRII